MTKRRFALAAITAAAALAITACAPTTSTPDADGDSAATGEFTYVIASDPSSLNPINVSDRWGLTVTNLIYSPLARVEGDGTVVNELAESIEPAADGLSVTVTLKDDLLWSDGEPLTADDVVFTYTQKAVKENGNADLLWIGDQPITATAEDEQTVVFHLPSISAAALSNIATETYIIPEHVYGDVTDFSGAELDPIAVGSGPYALTEYERGQYLTFEANENYYGEPANIENLTLRIVANADTVKTALQTGEADASFVTADQIDELEASGLDVYPYAEGRVAYLGLNAATLTDPEVRQAIFFALNRDDINTAAFLSSDYYENAYTILPPSNPFATDDVETYEQDADKSASLLEGAGAEGLTFTLAYAGADPAQTTQATLIQQQLQDAGITVELAGVEPAAVYAEIEKGADSQYDAFLGGYIMGQDPDAYSLLYRTGASANYFSYSNPETDALFDAGAVELDAAARADVYADLQAQIAEDAVIYPLADNLKILAVNSRIGGVEDARLVPIYTLENFGLLTEK
ncbi:peptide/nickel transport system substrate-binding protein [Microbacterium terrae]|uniref:Oligopeptide-binding protein AppA n=1 Tax=Microbacterium terrae TaxID=69369 RepID=A0A0M2H5R6_9MICO|nr:ABC transporter substrate-binding protein [Microbacterium terrae]KJL39349.1 Oligopeptide-binding protein AppA precursor [Microbacterium terrae]MBP1078363.1 peptide/nickel transport system substrate-binding protein [Microbacterium terrae]GLJ97843.1 peptide ABC transporter substrate-binding protein [Microbacterium terrae]